MIGQSGQNIPVPQARTVQAATPQGPSPAQQAIGLSDAANQINVQQNSVAPMQARAITAQETVAGQMNALMAKDSEYRRVNEAAGLRVAAQRGMQNSTMGAGLGLKQAYDGFMPIAQQDAQTFAAAGQSAQDATQQGILSAQQSAQTMEEDINKGVISRALTTNEYALKAGLSEQEANQAMDLMMREYVERRGLSEQEALQEIQRMTTEFSLDEQKAYLDDLRAQNMSRINADYQLQLDNAKNQWDYTIRAMQETNSFNIAAMQEQTKWAITVSEANAVQYIEELKLDQARKENLMALMKDFGTRFQADVAAISMTSNLDSTAKGNALANAAYAYMQSMGMAADFFGINIDWTEDVASNPLNQDWGSGGGSSGGQAMDYQAFLNSLNNGGGTGGGSGVDPNTLS
jgi:hypothetical protein